MKKVLTVLFVLFSIFILASLFLSYFQQDEWHSFGVLQSYGKSIYLNSSDNYLDFFYGRPGSRLIMMSLFEFFQTNAYAFGIFSAGVHILNSTLVFLVALKLSKNRTISYIAAFFFLINSVASQSYMWFGTMASSLPSVTFSLFSIYFYIDFLRSRELKHVLLSLIFLFTSFMFKEGGYALFITFPIIWFLYTDKKSLKKFLKENFPILALGVLNTWIFVNDFLFIPGERANYIASSQSGLIKLLGHLVSYPLEGFSQIFTPAPLIFGIARQATRFFFPLLTPDTPDFDLFYTTRAAEAVSLLATFVLAAFIIVLYRGFKKNISSIYLKTLITSLALTIFSFIPFVILDKSDAYLDSRYYYPSLLGASIFLGTFLLVIFENLREKSLKKIALTLLILFFAYHALSLGRDLLSQTEVSQERIKIVRTITDTVPSLKDKTVFYVSGDSGGYYALPELKVPFQSGLGQMLMVIYDDPEIHPFFKEETLLKTLDGGFLYDTIAQGYRESGKRGFGYFTDKDKLEDTILKFNIDISESVFAFYYRSDSKTLVNITNDFRKQIEEDLNQR